MIKDATFPRSRIENDLEIHFECEVKARQLYLYCAFHTQGQLNALHSLCYIKYLTNGFAYHAS